MPPPRCNGRMFGGLDLASSLNATGGIGALVQIVDHTGTATAYLPAYDGGGNVAALMSSDGSAAAIYEYGPFGERMRAEGTYATTNPFRHATKFTDEESGLVYYGRRYYSPSLGRFISRDPIGAAGGPNLYGFVANNPINRWDYMGMDPVKMDAFVVSSARVTLADISAMLSSAAAMSTLGWAYMDSPYDYMSFEGTSIIGPAGPVAPNKPLSKKECDDLAGKISSVEGTLGHIAKREGPAGASWASKVWNALESPGQVGGIVHDSWENGYRLTKASLEAAGVPMRDAYKNVAKYSNGLDNVLKVKDVWQLGLDIQNRDGQMFISHSAETILGWTNWTPGLNLVTMGARIGINTAISNLQDGVDIMEATSLAADRQETALHVTQALKNLDSLKAAFKNGGCGGK